MFVIIGIVVVFGSVIGGFLMEGGNLHVLFQPAELVIIFGASIGALKSRARKNTWKFSLSCINYSQR
ncbi:MAG: chemotaxis protein MotA [bacterium]|nr:MAG: chemotaxis protein MotA [bacterium]